MTGRTQDGDTITVILVVEADEPMREFEASQVEDGWRPLRGQED